MYSQKYFRFCNSRSGYFKQNFKKSAGSRKKTFLKFPLEGCSSTSRLNILIKLSVAHEGRKVRSLTLRFLALLYVLTFNDT
jgi:hypothetical protein